MYDLSQEFPIWGKAFVCFVRPVVSKATHFDSKKNKDKHVQSILFTFDNAHDPLKYFKTVRMTLKAF